MCYADCGVRFVFSSCSAVLHFPPFTYTSCSSMRLPHCRTEERNMLTSIVWNLHMSEDPFTHSLTGKGISFLIQTFGKVSNQRSWLCPHIRFTEVNASCSHFQRKKEELIDFYGAYAVGTILYNCGVLDPSISKYYLTRPQHCLL